VTVVVIVCHRLGSRGGSLLPGVQLPWRPTPSVNISPCKWMDSSVIWRWSGFGDPSPVSVLDCSPLAPFPVSLSCFGNPAHHRLLRTFRLGVGSQTSCSRYHVWKINRSVLVVGKEWIGASVYHDVLYKCTIDRVNQERRGVTCCTVYSFKYTPFCFQRSLRARSHKS
jgi:hypothetical protein